MRSLAAVNWLVSHSTSDLVRPSRDDREGIPDVFVSLGNNWDTPNSLSGYVPCVCAASPTF